MDFVILSQDIFTVGLLAHLVNENLLQETFNRY